MKKRNKKILIISYYWPPSGGSGVQRWAKFAKYLVKHGYDPIIYTPKNPEYPSTDTTLEKEIPAGITVLKTEIWEPFNLYKKLANKNKNEKVNAGFLTESGKKNKWIESFSIWIRGNFFIPDARKFWIKPSIEYLTKYIKQYPVDLIISTGPPHSMHLIAMGVKKNTSTPWLADFRDPWTNIDFYKDLKLTRMADRKHRKLERNVLLSADSIVCVGETMANEIKGLGGKNVKVITNGYDHTDVPDSVDKNNSVFSISHIGTLNKSRNPINLWESLSVLTKSNPDFAEKLEIKLIGKIDISVKDSIKKYDLEKYLKLIPYLDHKLSIKEQFKSNILLLFINNTPNAKGILTGKLFEYLSAKKPILSIGPIDGDAAKIISNCNAGVTVDYHDKRTIESFLLSHFTKTATFNPTGYEIYSRENLTKSLIVEIEKTIKANTIDV